LKELKLLLNPNASRNLDACLDAIFSLDQLAFLSIRWNGMSVEKIKSSLNKHGGTKSLYFFGLFGLDRDMNEADILEICSFLPDLQIWEGKVSGSDLTVDGAREWKRICPNFSTAYIDGGDDLDGAVSAEVREELRGLGVKVFRRSVIEF
jgi:hypothetical protein